MNENNNLITGSEREVIAWARHCVEWHKKYLHKWIHNPMINMGNACGHLPIIAKLADLAGIDGEVTQEGCKNCLWFVSRETELDGRSDMGLCRNLSRTFGRYGTASVTVNDIEAVPRVYEVYVPDDFFCKNFEARE